MKTMSREMSKMYAEINKVEIEKLLSSIHVFHEVSYAEYKIQDHPYIELYADGSGAVYSVRGQKTLFSFNNLEAFVKKADGLMDKHNIKWVD